MLSGSGVSLRMDMFFLYLGDKRPNREVFAHGFGGVCACLFASPRKDVDSRLASFILATNLHQLHNIPNDPLSAI